MTADEFALAIGLLFGDVSPVAGAADALGVSKANVQRWASDQPIPDGVKGEIIAFLRERRSAIGELLADLE